MFDANDLSWLDERIKERAAEGEQRRLKRHAPTVVMVDAGKFATQLAQLAETIVFSLEREGLSKVPNSTVSLDSATIIRQILHTYRLFLYLNADERRNNDPHYQQSYSSVILPLVRTMIDGFYNCTAMLDDLSRTKIFRISGLYRLREAIRDDEARYRSDPAWKESLASRREFLEDYMRVEQLTDADLDDRKNKWPLLQQYLNTGPDTPHKQLLRTFTLSFWKEYSSISHAGYDGLINIFPFIAKDKVPVEERSRILAVGDRLNTMHIGRAAAVLLCLLTEIQHFYKFEGSARIDERLGEIWAAMLPLYEANELYRSRYHSLLKKPSL